MPRSRATRPPRGSHGSAAGPRATPRLELATPVDSAPRGPGWLHELDYGGERLACSKRAGQVRIEGPDGTARTTRHPELAGAIARLPSATLFIDGTLSDGVYYAFDLLRVGARDTAKLPLVERKRLLRELLAGAPPPLRYCDHLLGDGRRVVREACKLGARGVISKRSDAPHRAGPSDGWLHVRCPERSQRSRAGERIAIAGVPISSPQRVMYPALGFTKRDLVQFYADVSPWLLPHVRGRPLTLVRCEHGASRPDALRSQCQFLRHSAGWHRFVPDSVHREQIVEQRKRGEYLVIQREADLLAILNGDILELHTWNATIPDIERPDRVVFDLDPAADVAWHEVKAAAHALRAQLREYGLESWLKTTGGKGLHVSVPLRAASGWDACYQFTQRVAKQLERAQPRKFTLDFSRAARSGRILIDFKRNHRAAVAIAAFSTRARPHGPVSVPIAWQELDALSGPDGWTVLNLRERLAQLSVDPWRDYWLCQQTLP
jgi:DNA ligase D-like protein (predicted polymerase)